jgi:molecular chaperone GrpE
MDDRSDTVDGPVKVVDRRRWAHGESAAADAAPRKPAYVEELERLLAEKDKAIQAHAARYRESAGEFEQVRARLRRDVDKEVERARRGVLADVLDVIDNLDRALAAARDAGSGGGTTDAAACASLVKGVELVRDLLLAKLASYGVTPAGAEGQPFDPRVHDAVAILPVTAPDEDERVVSVVRPGYAIGEDVLRPATVVVGRYEP